MIIENQNSVKKRYQPPILEVVMLDNHIALEVISEGSPPIEPESTSAFDGSDSHSKKLFPDAPASDSPFGGSSPNYK